MSSMVYQESESSVMTLSSLVPQTLSTTAQNINSVNQTRQTASLTIHENKVEEQASCCLPCQSPTPKTKHQSLQMSELPQGPWRNVSVDFCCPFPSGDFLLVRLDQYSQFPFVEIVPFHTSMQSHPCHKKMFPSTGIFQVVKSDNVIISILRQNFHVYFILVSTSQKSLNTGHKLLLTKAAHPFDI